MAKNLSFRINVKLENEGALPELGYRTAHLAPAFQAIFEEWVSINAQKFEQSAGEEISGADIFGEEWAPVTMAYYQQKHSQGKAKVTKKEMRGGAARFSGPYPDWLLVRTGALREAMTNPDALFSLIEDDQALFGTPNDPDLADIVAWQAGARQKNRGALFSCQTQTMNGIKRILQAYLSFGVPFQQMLSEAGMATVSRETQTEALDASFDVAVGSDTGDLVNERDPEQINGGCERDQGPRRSHGCAHSAVCEYQNLFSF